MVWREGRIASRVLDFRCGVVIAGEPL